MENMIKYYGVTNSNKKVVEAIVDNLRINISKQLDEESDCEVFAIQITEDNKYMNSTIEYDTYILDEYEVEYLYEKETCYDLLSTYFEQNCCSYAII